MFSNILLPVDLGNLETQDKAISTAALMAENQGARLHILSIIPDLGVGFVGSFFPRDFQARAMEEARKQIEAFVLDRFAGKTNVSPLISHGTIYQEILKVAGDCGADLIVMASHRPELADYMLGPNASRVVRHASCSVLVVRD